MSETEMSRGDVLLKGALAAGSLYGLDAIGPYVRRATAAGGDVHTLNFLLMFEYMQASLYNRGYSEINDKGEKMRLEPDQKELVGLLLEEEGEHATAVKGMIEKLGGKPEPKGTFAFAFRIYESLLVLAGMIESASIGAYNGAIPSLKSKEARDLAFSIVQVEGRHAAAVAMPIGEEPAPEAFDIGLTEESAINITAQFTAVYA
jgi:rubrerythrin